MAHLGTNDSRAIVARMQEGDSQAEFYFKAMCYQIAKEIGRISTVLCGKVDQIILTGGLAHSPELVAEIKPKVEFIAPVMVLPGENELEALAPVSYTHLDVYKRQVPDGTTWPRPAGSWACGSRTAG